MAQDALDDASSTNRPLIASVAPMDVLRAEYENGSRSFVKQIDYLKGQGYAGIRRTRGDGDCFYRCASTLPSYPSSPRHPSYHSFLQTSSSVTLCTPSLHLLVSRYVHVYDPQDLPTPLSIPHHPSHMPSALAFAYIERILASEDLSLAVMTAISTLDSTLPMLDAAGFEKIVYEDWYDVFVGLIRSIGEPDAGGKVLTPEGLLEAFQNVEGRYFYTIIAVEASHLSYIWVREIC